MIRTNDPRQTSLTGTGADMAGLARLKAAASLRARKPQIPCDHGLFSDEAAQLDLEDASLWRDR